MLKMFLANFKMLIRNKQALFWSLTFPLIFTFIFGLFFGSGSTQSGTVAIINKSSSELATNLVKTLVDSKDIFKTQTETDTNVARDLIKSGKIIASVEIPAGFGDASSNSPTQVTIQYDPGNSFSNQAVLGFVNSYLTQVNFSLQNAKMIYTVNTKATSSNNLSYFDFVLIGLLGMALMNSSVHGVAIAMSTYKEEKILKRLTTTPLKSWIFVVSEVLSRLVVNMLQISLILIIGIYLFKAHINGNIGLIYVFSMLGAIIFQLIGFVIASISKTTRAAEGMATAMTIPMMFLSGVFFPLDQLPKWISSFVQFLPLSPLLRMMRQIGLDNSSPLQNPINIIIVFSWIAVLLFISVWRFRLNEE
jgi:ABC-2 type transport system permease protein